MIYKELYTIALFGHRDFIAHHDAEEPLRKLLYRYANACRYLELLVGRNGEFDTFASSVIRSVKREAPEKIFLHLALPYMTAEYRDNEESFHNFYDEVEILPMQLNVHPKAAISKRNACMIDRADVVILYLEYETGGVYNAFQYAKKKGKCIINLKEFL